MTSGARDFIRKTWIPFALLVVVAGLASYSSGLAADPASEGGESPEFSRQTQRGGGGGQRGGQRGGRGGAGPYWWRDEAVKAELALDDAVGERIDVLWQAHVRQFRTYGAEHRKESDALEAMTRERAASIEQFRLQVSRVESLSAEIRKNRTVALYQILLELTPEQAVKLNEIRERRRGGRGSGPPR